MKRHYFICLFLASLLVLACSHLKEARTAYEEKNFARTILLTRDAVAVDSTDIDAYLLLIRSYRELDSLDRALETSLSARRDNPESTEIPEELVWIHIDIGDRALSANHPKRALNHFLSAEDLAPASPEILHKTADLYFQFGQLDDAKQRYLRILQSTGDSSKVRDQLNSIKERTQNAQELFVKGMKEYDTGRFKTAQALFGQAVQKKADFDDAAYFGLMSEGLYLQNRGSQRTLWEAISAFGKAATIRPDAPEPHFHMAKAYEKKDDDEFINAIDAYETALRLDPQGPNVAVIRERLDIVKKRKEKLDKFWGRKK